MIAAVWVSIDRLFHPHEVTFPGAMAVAPIIGFLDNEAATRLWISGSEIRSGAPPGSRMASMRGQTGSQVLRSCQEPLGPGHGLHDEIKRTVGIAPSVAREHKAAREHRYVLLVYLKNLADATIHVDPSEKS